MQRCRGTIIHKQELVLNLIYQKLRLVKEFWNKVRKISGVEFMEGNSVQIYSQKHNHEWRLLTSPLDCKIAALCLCIPTSFNNKQDTLVLWVLNVHRPIDTTQYMRSDSGYMYFFKRKNLIERVNPLFSLLRNDPWCLPLNQLQPNSLGPWSHSHLSQLIPASLDTDKGVSWYTLSLLHEALFLSILRGYWCGTCFGK